jgi:hypothetical protein
VVEDVEELSPDPQVLKLRSIPVSRLVAVIFTPGTTAPVASVTVPVMVPVPMVCENAQGAIARQTGKTQRYNMAASFLHGLKAVTQGPRNLLRLIAPASSRTV